MALDRLVLSEGTVKSHVKNILRKLGAANRAEAVSKWLREQNASAGTGRPPVSLPARSPVVPAQPTRRWSEPSR